MVMVRRAPSLLTAVSLLLCAGTTACAASTQQAVGVSAPLDSEETAASADEATLPDSSAEDGPAGSAPDQEVPKNGGDADPAQTAEAQPDSEWVATERGGEEGMPSAPAAHPGLEAELLRVDQHHQELARLALHQADGVENHFHLKIAISERAADLPWIVAVENGSTHTLRLAALPSLLRFDVTGPGDVGTTRCGGEDIPRALTADATTELEPGQMLYYAFDPRRLCKDSRTLSAGAQVVVSYGFEKQTKKLWQGGKMVEIDAKQTDPFVARVAAGDAQEDPQMAGLKHVVADPFVLGATYPLEDVALEETAAKDVAPPPLRLSVPDLGTLSSPESSAIRVTVTNTSGRTLPLLLRREIIRYEVIGQWSSATCIMDPTDRAPDPAGFTTLSPGESQTLITRLAEACPPETFRYPGRYAISARLTATATGSEHGIDAFVGSVATREPAELYIPARSKGPLMRVAPSVRRPDVE